jgi:glycerophosphoryl diester phosphodiesterase
MASLISGNFAILIFLLFCIGAIASPARYKIRHLLKHSLNKENIEYSLSQNIELLGHRGVRVGAVENTLSAIKKAKEHGAKGIEIDARFTKDNVPILMHDPSLHRIGKTKQNIHQITYEELKKIKLAGENIPTLEQALKLSKKLDLIVNLEIKNNPKITNKQLDIILNLVNEFFTIKRLSISSFDQNIIATIKEKQPEIITGYISYGLEFDWLKKAKQAKADYVNFHLMGLQLNQMEKILLCKQNNFAVKTWPVNDLQTANNLINSGIDGIISDNPKILLKGSMI